MVEKARANAVKLGYENVSFYEGDIEALPLPDGRVDVVVSNCVLNLVPDTRKAFAEMHRVLRPGGHFCVSDIVVRGALPPAVRASAELYVGCVAGAIQEREYLAMLRETGFSAVRVVKAREIELPNGVFEGLLSGDEMETLRRSGAAVVSVTVYGER
jgi:ubiquinone/menaquinone biosynthesis C-methylase UbiE